MQMEAEEKLLDIDCFDQLLHHYSVAEKRLLLLNYDGAVVPFSNFPSTAVPGKHVLDILKELSTETRNEVCIVSGRDLKTLESWMGHLPLTLIAEHGAKIRYKGGNWELRASSQREEKLSGIYKVMEQYTSQCPGTFIEKKEFSLAWHYRNADWDMGMETAKKLYKVLLDYTELEALDVYQGNKVLEVRMEGVGKGTAIESVLTKQAHNFILCIGSDPSDEDMFKRLKPFDQAYTIKVGSDYSAARFTVHTPYMVQLLLQTMSINLT